ncbi:MAG: 1-acyl-sn-glycerol-3-phosphate acyltransferase [Anaerolineales bacterium]
MNLNRLTEINLDDLVSSFGWQNSPLAASLLRRVFYSAAETFAKQMLEFDSSIAAMTFAAAARRALERYARGLRVIHPERIPSSGFLALSNHPGMTDALALFAALQRNDLRIIALDRPFLNALPNVSKKLFYVKEDSAARISLVRQAGGFLKSGGAALTFPAGKIEPDPSIYSGAEESLQTWTDSAEIFLRIAPQTPILPILVSGVIWHKTANSPLVKLKKTREEREKLAAALQLLSMVAQNSRPTLVTAQIGRPIYAESKGAKSLHRATLDEMKSLLKERETLV